MDIKIIKRQNCDFEDELKNLKATLHGGGLTSSAGGLDVPAIVGDIISRVAADGDTALVAYEAQLDKADLDIDQLRVPADMIANAHSHADEEFLTLIRRVIENIREYQEHIKVRAPEPMPRGGRTLGVRYTPIERVGLYVPGGRALYPSSVLMTAVPAIVAGVNEIVMVSPPNTNGDIHPMVLALAHELGISEVYRLGGAQAIAALALGTQTIRRVNKIVGPGNAFVAEAKRQLFGRVGIDSIAGPSEVLIIADQTACAKCVAADMMAQAEHDPGSAVLVTTSEKLAREVVDELHRQAQIEGLLSRIAPIIDCLERFSAIIIVDSLDQACDIANEFATEHLQIITADDEATLGKIRNAGAIFVGPYTPVPVGDYFAGPSHVLPTGGGAMCFSPLSVNDFLKSSSVIAYDKDSLKADGPEIADFATREGLTAHARSAMIRFESIDN